MRILFQLLLLVILFGGVVLFYKVIIDKLFPEKTDKESVSNNEKGFISTHILIAIALMITLSLTTMGCCKKRSADAKCIQETSNQTTTLKK